MRREYFVVTLILALLAAWACDSDSSDPAPTPDIVNGGSDVHFGNGGNGGDEDAAPPTGDIDGDEDTSGPASDVPTPPDDCEPNCGDFECGPDGCGGFCGECAPEERCYDGFCGPCRPDCDFRNCGDDGCGGSCGACGLYQECDERIGRCVMACIPNCAGRQCGSDGCGASCGTCEAGLVCNTANGACQQTCIPFCTTRECGTNGCGGSCGTCTFPKNCNEFSGRCVDECQRQCDGRICGDDACAGRCGYCDLGYGCNAAGQCEPLPLNCAEMLQCVGACGALDDECPDLCRAASNASSLSRYDLLMNCANTSCAGQTGSTLRDCLGASCKSQMTQCGLDFRCGDPGTVPCMNVSSCINSCGDAACVNRCLCQAREPSYNLALAYAECIVQACPTFESQCLQEAQMMMMGTCGMQWMNCMSGS